MGWWTGALSATSHSICNLPWLWLVNVPTGSWEEYHDGWTWVDTQRDFLCSCWNVWLWDFACLLRGTEEFLWLEAIIVETMETSEVLIYDMICSIIIIVIIVVVQPFIAISQKSQGSKSLCGENGRWNSVMIIAKSHPQAKISPSSKYLRRSFRGVTVA